MSALKSSMVSSIRLAAPAGLRVPRGGKIEKIFQDRVAVLGRDAFGMKLHAMYRQGLVRSAHHQPVAGLRGDGEFIRKGGAIDHQRMIARGFEGSVDAAEDALALMRDLGELAVHRYRCAHDLAAERLADGLQAEADAEHRDFFCCLFDELEANARLVRRAGTGREHDR